MWRDSFSLAELEFIAESKNIQIQPSFKKKEIQLISGTYGPFKPNKSIDVPLWFAMQLKKKMRCKIIVPGWMDPDFLIEILEKEKRNLNSFEALDFHFFEISQILFHR